MQVNASGLSDLEARRKWLRLPLRELAPLVPMGHNAVSDALKGRSSPHPVTRQAIEAAISAEERRLRDHLLGLHPLSTSGAAS